MMIESNFEINISKEVPRGLGGKPSQRHYAKVELGDCYEDTAREKMADFCQLFREEDGYKLELSRVECSGKVYATSG